MKGWGILHSEHGGLWDYGSIGTRLAESRAYPPRKKYDAECNFNLRVPEHLQG